MKNYKMFTVFSLALALILGSFVLTQAGPTQAGPALPEAALANSTLPLIADFETGGVGAWFTYGDYGSGAALTKTVALTNSLATLGVTSNTVMMVDYISAGWGLGTGKDLAPFQDWSAYDGLDFWFYGSNSGTVFKIILTDNSGERLATRFSDDFSGWQKLTFPWQVFYHDSDYQPGGAPDDGPTLTAVEAFAFAPLAPSQGAYAMDQIKLFKTPGAVVDDFQVGGVGAWFTYGDYGSGAALTKTAALTNSLSTLGVTSNTVMMVDYVSAGWGLGSGKDLAPFQDWSAYDGLDFWLYGSNSGTVFKIILTDNSGERLATKFSDDFSGWRELTFPWQVFYHDLDYQPGGAPDDGPTLTAVEAFAFAPLAPSQGAYAMDQIKLFKTPGSVVDDFQTGGVGAWFTYGDYGSGAALTKTAALTNSLSTLGVTSNTVMMVDYVSAGWGLGSGKDLSPFQDWSAYDGLDFWFYGSNSGTVFKIILTDNSGERLATKFSDDFSGWRELTFPWQVFYHDPDYQPGGAPDDGPTLTAVEAFAFAPLAPSQGAYAMDQVNVYGGAQELKVDFDRAEYFVGEGYTATITVTLNMTSAIPVTVTYTISDGSATAGSDYTGSGGLLVFPPDTLVQTFTVQTLEDAEEEGSENIALTLSDPISVTVGRSSATLTILDNEQADLCSRKQTMVDDFENGQLPSGYDGGIQIGFVTWSDGSPVAITLTQASDAGPLTMPGQVTTNTLLQLDSNIGGWGGFSHLFESAGADTWLTQDWSRYEGIGFWLYGTGSGVGLFFEIKDNRTGSPTQDDAEIWTHPFVDNVAGWRYVEIPFSDFTRKEIGNNAPNDGFGRQQVHGWALGSLSSNGAQVHYVDNIALVERVHIVDQFESGLPSGTDGYGNGIGFVTWGDASNTSLATLNVTRTNPLALPCQLASNTLLQVDYTISAWGGFSHGFENAAVDTWVSQDWSTYTGLRYWFYGANSGAQVRLDIMDNRAAGSTGDSAERFTYVFTDSFSGWQLFEIPFEDFERRPDWQPVGAPDDGFTLTEIWGYAFSMPAGVGARTNYVDYVMLYGDTRQPPLSVSFDMAEYTVNEGDTTTVTAILNGSPAQPVVVTYTVGESSASIGKDYAFVSGTLTFAPDVTQQSFSLDTHDDMKYEGVERVVLLLFDPINAALGFQRRAVLLIQDNDMPDPTLLDDFEGFHPFSVTGAVALSITEVTSGTGLAVPGQGDYEGILSVNTTGSGEFVRTYPEAQNWDGYDGINFWYYGANSGNPVTLQILDNQAVSTGNVLPGDWVLRWSDEFNDQAGTPPNANVWTHEIGDGALNDIVGWGNSELQYYTDSADNAATDGAGNLIITVSEVDTATSKLVCHYGPCEYTSARLISSHKAEFEYGRIEARIKVADGVGLWPAFWALGANINQVDWPQCGEIDIMEFVGRSPNEVFGTLHGPGYSGGNGLGSIYNFGSPVAPNYHTFSVEWAPDEIHWYVDGINYHNATPSNVSPNEWVFNQPFYVILNVAIGGNFGGPVGNDVTFPRQMLVDYVRVYQAADTAERFEATFNDNFSGWQHVNIPFSAFERAAGQPAGAPDDGLGLTEIWGYGFKLPAGSGAFYLDQVNVTEPAMDTQPVGAGCYDFSQTGSRICFDPIGSLTQVSVTLFHRYPTLQAPPRPLPLMYRISGDGTGFSATVSLRYNDSDLVGGIVEDDLQLYRYQGGAWQAYPSTVNTNTNTVTATQVTAFSAWAIGTAAHTPTAVVTQAMQVRGNAWLWALTLVLGAVITLWGGLQRARSNRNNG